MKPPAKPALKEPGSRRGPQNRGRDLTALILLTLAIFVVFWPLTRAEFINYDDPDYVTNNLHVRGLTGPNISWAFQSLFIYWQPLTWLSYMVDYELYGLKASGFHLTNLALHVGNSLVLFVFLKRATGAHWRSLLVTALFAFHPLHVETVAWISERKGALSTLFWFLALVAYERYARRPGAGRYLMVIVCFALGLMAKSMLVTFPFMLLLLDWWPLRRFRDSPHGATTLDVEKKQAPLGLSRKTLGFLLLEKVPLLALSAVSGVLTLLAQRQADALVTLQSLPFVDRLANSIKAYGTYLIQTLWPMDLIVFYPRTEHWAPGQLALAAAVILGISVMALVWMRRRPHLFVGWFWFLGVLVPVSGLLQAGDQAVADRYTYVPLVGLFILATWEAAKFAGNNAFVPRAIAGVGAAAAMACGIAASRQVRHWQSTQTLFEHAFRADPDNPQVCAVVGSLRSAEGRYDDAIRLFEHALRLNPKQSDAHVHLGLTLEKQNKLGEAVGHYGEALRIKPGYVEARLLLGLALSRQGKPSDAVEQFQAVLQLRPDSAAAHNNLAMALYAQGRADEAIAHLETALRIDPHLATARENLAVALQARGDPAQAAAHLRAALAVAPQSATAHLNLANILFSQGQTAGALDHLREAVRLEPDRAEWLNNLAWILATHPEAAFRNGAEAVRLADKACRLTEFKRAIFVGTLAAAQAETGSFDDAIRIGRMAHDLAIAAGEKELAETNLKLIELYRAQRPYRSDR
ncbi:MAG TPA: tetratricopeptide repeat protein [Verrucomicrobiae bacterium]|nr:tetratricopeptide repeat protein [Verrucomicrobiae bacterium]